MRVIVLSDHGGDQYRQTVQQVQAAGANAEAWQGAYRAASADLQQAKRAKPLWKRLLAVSTPEERLAHDQVRGTWQQTQQAWAGASAATHRAHQQAAGVGGEEALAQAMSVLPDEWVMLRGYRNRRGETDHVLVGPLGVWAVEVKCRRVRLHVDGDRWWYEKLDARGRAVERSDAVDGGGRSWGRQVTEVAGDLAGWLARNGQTVPVRTAVMIMHWQAQLGWCQHVPVDVLATHPNALLQAIGDRRTPLPADTCERIVALIRRDHTYHAQRRRRPH